MGNSMSLRNQMLYEKKKKIKVDGKEYDLDEFDETYHWEKLKSKKRR